VGKARPELSDVQEALEELFPDHSHYRADALQAWEKRLRPAPDKAAKADNDSSVTLADIEHFYEIGRVVGDGNFAVVRECCRRDNKQTLAVKIVERSKLIGREHMMQNELSLLGSLCHPRIVRLLAHHHTHTHSYLVMELVSGGDLFEAISERGKFPEGESGLMVSDVSEALNYIHCKSIVHRDLKPENLLVKHMAAGICRLKLADFGLAMVVTEPVFTICGTPTYVAPEILCETGYSVAVDVWALGIILYILLCGFPPFRSRDRDQEELFQLIKQGQLHFLSPYWDPISEGEKYRNIKCAPTNPEALSELSDLDASLGEGYGFYLQAEGAHRHNSEGHSSYWCRTRQVQTSPETYSDQCSQNSARQNTRSNQQRGRGHTERVQR
uniref:Doublecortin-like kinase 3 n=1 Tax=Cyclopterus lumpus TaxID=8103 RepID=A0A8C3ADC8_CYCLU